jgi:hypothetical protein
MTGDSPAIITDATSSALIDPNPVMSLPVAMNVDAVRNAALRSKYAMA